MGSLMVGGMLCSVIVNDTSFRVGKMMYRPSTEGRGKGVQHECTKGQFGRSWNKQREKLRYGT